MLDVVTAAISELTTLILSAQDTAGQCPLNTLENIGRHREELGEQCETLKFGICFQ